MRKGKMKNGDLVDQILLGDLGRLSMIIIKGIMIKSNVFLHTKEENNDGWETVGKKPKRKHKQVVDYHIKLRNGRLIPTQILKMVLNGRYPTMGKPRGPGGNGGSPFEEALIANFYPKIAKVMSKIGRITSQLYFPRYLEMRGAGGLWRRLCALPAFWIKEYSVVAFDYTKKRCTW
ncbi:hypothetical protein LXL04_033218 [Taraxacum kok-saghyz]